MEDLLPFYLSIGVSYEKFMDSAPVDLEPYDRMYRLIRNRENETMYLQGIYFMNALSATVGNMFSKRGSKKIEYPSEPHRIFPMTEEEKKAKAEEELKKFLGWSSGVKTMVEEKINN